VKAAVYYGRGDVRVEDVHEPSGPAAGELLIEVGRASICGTDASEWAHGPLQIPLREPHPGSGHRGPLVLGHEFMGRVVAIGDGVEGFGPGDRVVSGAGVSCGTCSWCRDGRTNLCASYYTLGLHADGGLARFVRAPASICRHVPDALGDDAASLAQPLAVALHAVRRGGARSGESVALIGVGGIGAFVLAAAAARGASPLIAVDVDRERLETAHLLGADVVVDARAGDVTAAIRSATRNEGAHLVIEAAGVPGAPASALAAARRGGRVLQVGLHAEPVELDLFGATVREVDVVTTNAHVCGEDLPEAVQLLATTDLASHVIDRVIPLTALVEEGLKPVAEGTARGKIVVDPAR
jgi:(R,R)-butanediol dehydrogenase/meso-butanediol dehydrogenase/diacetyl reductase